MSLRLYRRAFQMSVTPNTSRVLFMLITWPCQIRCTLHIAQLLFFFLLLPRLSRLIMRRTKRFSLSRLARRFLGSGEQMAVHPIVWSRNYWKTDFYCCREVTSTSFKTAMLQKRDRRVGGMGRMTVHDQNTFGVAGLTGNELNDWLKIWWIIHYRLSPLDFFRNRTSTN